jgi:hypothetical protein
VVSGVPVDDEAPLVTSRISRFAGVQSFGGAHRGRVCVRVFIWVIVRACCERGTRFDSTYGLSYTVTCLTTTKNLNLFRGHKIQKEDWRRPENGKTNPVTLLLISY